MWDCPQLKKLLLAPANSQLSYNQYTGGKAQNHAASSNHRIRPPPAVVKVGTPARARTATLLCPFHSLCARISRQCLLLLPPPPLPLFWWLSLEDARLLLHSACPRGPSRNENRLIAVGLSRRSFGTVVSLAPPLIRLGVVPVGGRRKKGKREGGGGADCDRRACSEIDALRQQDQNIRLDVLIR